MKEYIERQAALDAIGAEIPEPSAPDFSGVRDYEVHIASEAFADAGLAVRKVPAADVRPVVHARWITQMEGLDQLRYTCTRCGLFRIAPTRVPHGWHFCPRCGAQMDGEEEATT